MTNDEVSQPQEGDQGQVGGPQVPLPGHGDEIETPNWALGEYRTRIEIFQGQPTSARWPGPGQLITGTSSRPWG